MKNLLKDTVKPLQNYLRDRTLKEFYRLLDKWGGYERYRLVKNVEFLNYIFDVPDLASFIWQFKEIFVEEIYNFQAHTECPIIYDCGANIGMSCLYFKMIYPNSKIKAFEVDPTIEKILRKNLKRNTILNGIEIINKAVWINNREVNFSIEGADGGSIYGPKNKIKVKSIRLKDLLEKENRIDMLKIDIEGAELDVLQDCKNNLYNVQNIFIEYHSWNNKCQQLSTILEILEENGFRYYMENVTKVKHPFKNFKNREETMIDLQVNIFAVAR